MSQIWEQNIIFWCNSVCNFILASKSYNLVLLTSLWTLFQNERILQINFKKIKMRKLGRCIPSTQSTVYLTQVLVLLCLHQTLVALLCEHWNKSLIQIYCKVLEWLLWERVDSSHPWHWMEPSWSRWERPSDWNWDLR